jgi:hypothetical protein
MADVLISSSQNLLSVTIVRKPSENQTKASVEITRKLVKGKRQGGVNGYHDCDLINQMTSEQGLEP